MIISEKQIYELINVARFVCLNWNGVFKDNVQDLIAEIEDQQSEKLIEIKDE